MKLQHKTLSQIVDEIKGNELNNAENLCLFKYTVHL